MTIDTYIAVLSASAQGNALGRALSLGLVAREIAETDVYAVGHGELWIGAGNLGPTRQVPSSRDLATTIADRADGRRVVLWVSKGMQPVPRILTRLRSMLPGRPTVLVDFDDDDEGLAREWVGHSLRRRLQLNPARPGSPERVRRAQVRAAAAADARTVATWAVEQRVPGPRLSTIRIPHARHPIERVPPTPSSRLRVGFLGTWRPHKETIHLEALARRYRDEVELVTFQQPGLENDTRWTLLPRGCSLAEAYSRIDVLALPMRRGGASEVQLPAKLVDAFAAGLPTVATPTLAVREIAGESIAYVDDWADSTTLLGSLQRAVATFDVAASRALWGDMLDPRRQAVDLRRLLETRA